MTKYFTQSLLVSTFLVATSGLAASSFAASVAGIPAAADGIGGVVTSSKGPEAGVWVIAETTDTPTRMLKIVVTDDQGRFYGPELPKAKYQLFVRGYGLVDSQRVAGEPGKNINLTAVVAPSAKAAAEVYPANYWLSLIKVPDASEFPGTGPKGNGISPRMQTQQQWLQQMGDQCQQCHQQGSSITRNLADNTIEGWAERLIKARGAEDQAIANNGQNYATSMNNAMTAFGRVRGLAMWTDWTQRIEKGELPKETPPRPVGIERNVVLTSYDWANGRYVHDISVSDRHDPTQNANGPVYGVVLWWGYLEALDPKTGKTAEFGYKITPGKGAEVLPPDVAPDDRPHNPMVDKNGNVWMTDIGKNGAPKPGTEPYPDRLPYCTEPSNKFAKYFPQPGKARNMAVQFISKTSKGDGVSMCNSIHHLQFNVNRKDLYFSGGDNKVVSWLDIDEWAKSRDPAKAVSWCPMVVDSNAADPTKRPAPGDITITPDRAAWNNPPEIRGAGEEGGGVADVVALDPKKDTRVQGFLYGVDAGVSDGSIWFAKTGPFPGQFIRFHPGSNPPETCHTEMYQPPKLPDGKDFISFNARGVSVDSKGVAWGFSGNGQLQRFDRNACKNVAGAAAATGEQCNEGWSVYDAPGPKIAGTKAGTADFHYLGWVDLHNTLGMGKDTVITAGSNSDSLLAFNDTTKKYSVLRVPYPLGFRTRGLDGRIDDPKGDWKGRGAWATYSSAPVWHQEGGEEGSGPFIVKFQVRPDPLAK